MSRVQPVTAADWHEAGWRALERTRSVADWIAGGAGREETLAANKDAFTRVPLRPRILRDVSSADTSVEILGQRWAAPIGIAPSAYHRLIHRDGELGTTDAAGQAGMPMCVSMFASTELEAIAKTATSPLWMQLYMLRDRKTTLTVAARAAAAGYQALVVTADSPIIGDRPRDRRNRFTIPPDVRPVNLDDAAGYEDPAAHAAATFDTSFTWRGLHELHDIGLPLVLKGIMTGEDAQLAVSYGAAAIVVSNHGGRQLDRAPATLDVLPEIAEAARGRIPVLLDGGVTRGVDVLTALALGADAVLVGRAVLWALAAEGRDGAASLLAHLKTEFAQAMMLCGRSAVSDIGRDVLQAPDPRELLRRAAGPRRHSRLPDAPGTIPQA